MLENYLSRNDYVSNERINGVLYIALKRMYGYDSRYKIIKAGQDDKVIAFCDTKKEIEKAFSKMRMDARDAAIQAKRESLERRGINAFAEHGGSMKKIYEAYRDAKGF